MLLSYGLPYPLYQLIKQGHMQIGEVDKQQAVIYLTVLVVIEVLNFIFTIVSNQQGLIFLNLLRILLLVGAHCMKNVAWAAYYAIFALIATVYVFDPVGLWITGHGDGHTKAQNAFALVLFLGCGAAVVIGYFYKQAMEKEIQEDFVGDANPAGYSNPNEPSQGNRYMYRAAQNSNPQQPQARRFQQFTGQGYSLAD